MSAIVIKCPFGHDCFFDDLVAQIRCTKCEQYLNYCNFDDWMKGKIGLMDNLIHIKVPKLIFRGFENIH